MAVAANKNVLNGGLYISAKHDHLDFDFLCEHLTQINKERATMMQAEASLDRSTAVLRSKYADQMAVKNVDNLNCSHGIFRKIAVDFVGDVWLQV